MSSTQWSRISSDSYLLEIRQSKFITRVSRAEDRVHIVFGPTEDNVVQTSLPQVQASSSHVIADFVATNFQRCLEQDSRESAEAGMSLISAFLREFISTNPPGTPRIAVIELAIANFRISAVQQEVTDVERYLAEFRARLVERRYNLELMS